MPPRAHWLNQTSTAALSSGRSNTSVNVTVPTSDMKCDGSSDNITFGSNCFWTDLINRTAASIAETQGICVYALKCQMSREAFTGNARQSQRSCLNRNPWATWKAFLRSTLSILKSNTISTSIIFRMMGKLIQIERSNSFCPDNSCCCGNIFNNLGNSVLGKGSESFWQQSTFCSQIFETKKLWTWYLSAKLWMSLKWKRTYVCH